MRTDRTDRTDLELYDVSNGHVTWILPKSSTGQQWIVDHVLVEGKGVFQYESHVGVGKRMLNQLKPKMNGLSIVCNL